MVPRHTTFSMTLNEHECTISLYSILGGQGTTPTWGAYNSHLGGHTTLTYGRTILTWGHTTPTWGHTTFT